MVPIRLPTQRSAAGHGRNYIDDEQRIVYKAPAANLLIAQLRHHY
jgi:Txe/YoeB family toxin of Txe-Axe toxin-antitoxin module